MLLANQTDKDCACDPGGVMTRLLVAVPMVRMRGECVLLSVWSVAGRIVTGANDCKRAVFERTFEFRHVSGRF